MSDQPPQTLDVEHLRLLRLFHFIFAGVTALFSCIPILHVGLGALMLAAPEVFGNAHNRPPRVLGLLFVGLGAAIILFGWAFAALVAWAGVNLGRRRHYFLCLITACLCCLSIPFGTLLGVFTIVVLSRPGVKAMFGQIAAPPA